MKIEDYNKYYIQGSDHYLIPKYVFMELFNEMINWKEESQRQKEVIDKAIEYISNKKAIINTDVIRIFDLFKIDEQGYTNELLDILKEGKNE